MNGTVFTVVSPSFTNTDSASATAGQPFSFVITTAAGSERSIKRVGKLPPGLTLIDNHNGTATISGTPKTSAKVGGAYSFTLVASFGPNSRHTTTAEQHLVITVSHAPVFTNKASSTARAHFPFSFTIKTSGYPLVTSIVNTGTLPPGLVLVNGHDGTARLTGIATSRGQFSMTLNGSNGVGSPASQILVVRVK
jgi:hypothetical protein